MDPPDYAPRSTYAAIDRPPAGLRLFERAPIVPLARWVSRVWMMESREAGTSRTLPDGCIDLIIGLPEPGVAHAYVAGLQSSASSFTYGPGERAVGVRLRPGAALGLLDVPADALTDSRDTLTALVGRTARDLEQRLCEAPTWHARMRAFEEFLVQRATRARTDPRVDRAIAQLVHTSGTATMRELTRDSGTSSRTLDRLIQQWVGTSPKRLALIIRFQRALARAAASPAYTWAALAAELGFSDQAHLTREFVRFTGVSPARLLPHRGARVADLFKAQEDPDATEER